MRTIPASVALQGKRWAVVCDGAATGTRIYGLYHTQDVAERICRDLNNRYRDITTYEVAHVTCD